MFNKLNENGIPNSRNLPPFFGDYITTI